MAPASPVKGHADDLAGRISFDVEREQAVAQPKQRAKTKSTYRSAAAGADHLGTNGPLGGPTLNHSHILKQPDTERFKGRFQLLTSLVDLPQRQPRVPVRRRVGKIDAINQHLDRIVDRAEFHQFAANPRALPQRQAFIANPLVDGSVRTQLEFLRLSVDQEFHGLAIPENQHTLLPFKGAFFLDQPEENLPGRQ